ncbi:MAG TPA: DNA methyltransferase [Phycisphaerae bacterium]|nr:DNA methyltransferase [Phycisphaerae bacterium]
MGKKRTMHSQSLPFAAQTAKMPEGYYSGDKPNPNLRAFVEQHLRERPYDHKTDNYDVPAFDKPIETTKATAIYNMHTYWSKKPHDAIREYIRHYTKPGDLVLDPFCGSGGTALAALMEGRKAIAIDRSPAATFITRNYCVPVDPNELRQAFERVKAKVRAETEWLYETRCDRCGGKAITAYTVYSQVFECPRCMAKLPLFDCEQVESLTAAGKPKKIKVCPHCHKKGHEEEISTRSERLGAIPVLVSYICQGGCKPARGERRHNDANKKKREYFEKYDLGKLKEIESKRIPHWYPPHKMMNVEDDNKPWGDEWREGRNFRTIAELFTKRNLWALATIRAAIQEEGTAVPPLLFAFTGILLGMSKMNRHRPDVSYPMNIMEGTYYLPQVSEETVPLRHIENKVEKIAKAYEAALQDLQCQGICVSTESACHLERLPSQSVDHIFTDPPYAEKVQYGELNFVWEAWLDLDTRWHNEEIIVNQTRGKTEVDWANMMRKAMAECYRVLKPGRWLSLCYHDTSEGTWALVQDIMAEAGFVVGQTDTALFIDTGQKSYNQLVADKVNKRDLVINFRKPKPGDWQVTQLLIPADADLPTFRDLARQIIREYLQANPGASKDRIYDELVSRMVRAGTMEAHNFEEILSEVAEEAKEPRMKDLFRKEDPNLLGTHEVGRWYLKDRELEITDAAEEAKEDAAAEKIGAFIEKVLDKNPGQEGVHYSDLFEQYVYSVQDKPRRPLVEWLLDYFYKTDEGTYRLPASDEEQKLKAEGRAKGTHRKIKRYRALLEQGVAVPEKIRPNDATLAEWIRHCKRSGLYEQGKLLYEKGGLNLERLPEEIVVNVEEDYQVCVRMLGRDSGKKGKGK